MSAIYHTIYSSSAGQRLDNYLIKKLKGVPKSHIYQIIRKEVRVNNGRKKINYRLNIGDTVRIPPIKITNKVYATVSDKLKTLLTNNIVYEDSAIIVLNKPSGLASHGGSGISLGVIEAMRQIYSDKLELIHRLDRDTSGCILIAKKRSALIDLQNQIRQGTVNKLYLALLKNAWQKKQYTIDMGIAKNNTKGQKKSFIKKDGYRAISHFIPIKNIHSTSFSLCFTKIIIKTGRTHQIRVHANYAKHPVVGDNKYGDF